MATEHELRNGYISIQRLKTLKTNFFYFEVLVGLLDFQQDYANLQKDVYEIWWKNEGWTKEGDSGMFIFVTWLESNVWFMISFDLIFEILFLLIRYIVRLVFMRVYSLVWIQIKIKI